MCVPVCLCSTRMESAGHHDHAPALIVICTGAATKLRLLVEQASGCCTVRGKGGINNQGVCVLVCVCSTRMMESAGQRDHAPALIVVCTRTTMMLRLLEASLQLLHGARRRRTQERCACSSVIVALGWEVLASAVTHLH